MSYFNLIQSQQESGNKQQLLQRAVKDNLSFLQRLQLLQKIEAHNGCVNSVSWNQRGSLLLSGSDDHNLVISDPFSWRPGTVIHTAHTANIFSAKFLPDTCDTKIVSCAGDGLIVYSDILRPQETAPCTFQCHAGTVYEIVSVPGDPHTFLSCGEDGTVRWFDTRIQTSCAREECREDILIVCERGVSSMSINPVLPFELAVGSSDSSVRVFDRRMLGTKMTGSSSNNSGLTAMISKFSVPEFEGNYRRITSVDYRSDGEEICVSYSSDYIYIFHPKENQSGSGKKLKVGRPWGRKTSARGRSSHSPPQPMKKLRLRGDWSDTGPNSRPETELRRGGERVEAATADRNTVQAQLLQRMTEALSRMLNDPGTRLAMQRLDSEPGESAGDRSQGAAARAEEEENDDDRMREERQRNMEADVRDSLNLDEPANSQRSAALTIQERWRRFRERKLRSRRETTLEVTTNDEGEISTVSVVQTPEQSGSEQSRTVATATTQHSHITEEDLSSALANVNVSEPTVAGGSLPESTAAGESLPESTAAGESLPEYTAAGESLPESTVAGERLHESTAAGERFPGSTTGGENLSQSSDITTAGNTTKDPVDTVGNKTDGTVPASLNTKDPKEKNQITDCDEISRLDTRDRKQRTSDHVVETEPGDSLITDHIESPDAETRSPTDTEPAEPGENDNGRESRNENLSHESANSANENRNCETVPETEVLVETAAAAGRAVDDLALQDSVEEEYRSRSRSRSREEEVGRRPEGGNLESLQDSYTHLRDTGLEPTVRLRYRSEGVTASSVDVGDSRPDSLPGPSRVVTGPGHVAFDPVTGVRRRRSGISSVPTSVILPESQEMRTSPEDTEEDGGVVEYEIDSEDEEEDGEEEEDRRRRLGAGELGFCGQPRSFSPRTIIQPPVRRRLCGHRNARTMIKEATWWGKNFVLSGSDCGHLFGWDRNTGEMVLMLEADRHVVNCVAPHPSLPFLATSGIDYDVKLWSPEAEESQFDSQAAEIVSRRNEVMLEETRDTITVPASLMIRMLASLNQIRRGQPVQQPPSEPE